MRILSIFALFIATAAVQAADLKFGVVDMARAFQEYHKTKEATEVMKGNRDKVTQDMNERYSAYKTKLADVQSKQKATQDPILTAEGRAKAQAELGSLVKEVRSMEQEIQEFQQRRSLQLRQEEADLERNLYVEIAAVVKKKSETDSYDFVFDKSGGGMNRVPVLLHHKNAIDFTDEVIVELNKGAGAKSSEATKPSEGAKGK
jgi:outer membrane protein